MCLPYEWSDVTQLSLHIEVRNFDSNEVTHRVNKMESHLIRKRGHVAPFVEWAQEPLEGIPGGILGSNA